MSLSILTVALVFTNSRKRPIHSVVYVTHVMVYTNPCSCIFTNSFRDSQIRGNRNNFVPILLSYFSHSFLSLFVVNVIYIVLALRVLNLLEEVR